MKSTETIPDEAAAFTPEYGTALGLATPQANSTAEPEIQRLLGAGSGFSVLTARLYSPIADSRTRLIDYFDRLESTLAQFDVAPLAAAGFACTGSCYLVGRADEDRRLDAASRAAGCPVVSAAQAIREVLETLGARRIALLSPYPQWLSEAGQRYWRDQGFTLTSVAGLPADLLDTRGIYRLTTARVLEVYAGLDTHGADAVLMSGTGMPTLRAIAALRAGNPGGIPIVSSTLCLAWLLARTAGGAPALERWVAADAPWHARLG
jgi:maleate isomerase